MKLLFIMGNRTLLRMVVLWQYTDKFIDKARKLGIGPLSNKILLLLIQPTLEDEEWHLLMKVIECCISWMSSSISMKITMLV